MCVKDYPIKQVSSHRHFSTFQVIQMDIGGHPPFLTSSKQFSGHFSNLVFLAVFNEARFQALNDVFWENRFEIWIFFQYFT
jgi:hypothetical protein